MGESIWNKQIFYSIAFTEFNEKSSPNFIRQIATNLKRENILKIPQLIIKHWCASVYRSLNFKKAQSLLIKNCDTQSFWGVLCTYMYPSDWYTGRYWYDLKKKVVLVIQFATPVWLQLCTALPSSRPGAFKRASASNLKEILPKF